MRWIYLSPHLDDAALSAGGLIYEQAESGVPVEIWTLMSGFPPEVEEYSLLAQVNHAVWGFSSAGETIHARRTEDMNAAGILGAQAVHFDFLDCIYRRGNDGGWLYDVTPVSPDDDADLSSRTKDAISSPPRDDDANLPSRIAEAISPRITRDDMLICQLSVGSHVDHVIVRQAAELLGRPLIYDIDIPYLFYKPEELAPKSAGMMEKVHAVTEAGLKSWQEAILAYTSQIPVLGAALDTPEKIRESIRSYWEERGGILLLESI
ncbi:MAG TPA: PIG-L family deacetylase [Anaerolineales bacterium]|nr:PIG-L family deacetylase [Anaerolineales bacterium]